MALPTSGDLSLKTTAGVSRSISCAVGSTSGSLTTLSITAGKSSPHCMREFYGYSALDDINVGIAYVGPTGFNSGYGGYIRVVCNFSIVTSCYIPTYEDQFRLVNFTVDPGTYCICFDVTVYDGGLSLAASIDWIISATNTGSGRLTSGFSSPADIDATIGTGGGGGEPSPF